MMAVMSTLEYADEVDGSHTPPSVAHGNGWRLVSVVPCRANRIFERDPSYGPGGIESEEVDAFRLFWEST
jgi:hypothetical protein